MAEKRRQGKRAKGFHLTVDVCEMLDQLCIVDNPVESFHINAALLDYFAKKKAFYAQAFDTDYWDRCLESVGHVDRLQRRVRRPSDKV